MLHELWGEEPSLGKHSLVLSEEFQQKGHLGSCFFPEPWALAGVLHGQSLRFGARKSLSWMTSVGEDITVEDQWAPTSAIHLGKGSALRTTLPAVCVFCECVSMHPNFWWSLPLRVAVISLSSKFIQAISSAFGSGGWCSHRNLTSGNPCT